MLPGLPGGLEREIIILNKGIVQGRSSSLAVGYVRRVGLPDLMLSASGGFLFIPVDAYEMSQAIKERRK